MGVSIKVDKAVSYLENMKWLKGYDNTEIGGVLIADIIDEIIALLKEQEPVKPLRKPELFDSLYFCGKCSAKVGFQIRKDDSWRFKHNYCPNCGKEVKWE